MGRGAIIMLVKGLEILRVDLMISEKGDSDDQSTHDRPLSRVR